MRGRWQGGLGSTSRIGGDVNRKVSGGGNFFFPLPWSTGAMVKILLNYGQGRGISHANVGEPPFTPALCSWLRQKRLVASRMPLSCEANWGQSLQFRGRWSFSASADPVLLGRGSLLGRRGKTSRSVVGGAQVQRRRSCVMLPACIPTRTAQACYPIMPNLRYIFLEKTSNLISKKISGYL